MAVKKLIVDHIDTWTTALQTRSTTGRGSSGKVDLYGIKKLRELILELAVRGKLVPQDPNDEPASELLKRIAAEKVQLVKQGKIKKQKPLPEISEEEKPFELPVGWEWVRFGNIYEMEYGSNLPQDKRTNSGEYNVFGSNGIVGTHNIACINSPCIVIGRKGSAGALNLSHNIGCWVTDVAYSTIPPVGIDLDFAFLQFHTLGLDSLGKGIKPGLNRNDAYGLAILVPPQNEQKVIVSKTKELMSLCDQLDQQSLTSLDAHQQLVEILLSTQTNSQNADELAENWARISEHFDTLFTTEASIDTLKQTILQLAVMGKLVQQDPNDSSAEVLLEQLSTSRNKKLRQQQADNKEAETMLRKINKLKKTKPPFRLPHNWTTVHLIELCEYLVDCHNKTAPYTNTGIPIIRTTNIRERRFLEQDLKFINQETYDFWSKRCPPSPGDIIFTREAPMGEALIIPPNVKWCLGQRTMLIRVMHEFVSNEFLLFALTEPHLLERASENAVGLTVKHLRVGDVENLNIPLPPLNEQYRIIDKVNILFEYCNKRACKRNCVNA
ncbi:restriction endonuclease subunit S [Salmonella enterica]|nr:restriction endonuclease subunit S [Salmonella enterica]